MAECSAAPAPGSAFPNDACFKYQWHMNQIGMTDAWKRGNGKGAVVAVIDTGVTKVADLGDTKFVAGYNFVANTSDAADDHGHGTHVAGTIAQATNNRIGVAGVAYGATIMPLKVLSARGSGSVAGIAQAIRWAADHGANVINMSLGGPMAVGTMGSAVKYARDKGIRVMGETCPKYLLFTSDLPKTRSGKIMRRLLRDVAEGRALGDTTTLADAGVVETIRAGAGVAEED